MCEKCAELNQQIEFCRQIAAHSDTQLTRDGIAMLLDSYSAEKKRVDRMDTLDE